MITTHMGNRQKTLSGVYCRGARENMHRGGLMSKYKRPARFFVFSVLMFCHIAAAHGGGMQDLDRLMGMGGRGADLQRRLEALGLGIQWGDGFDAGLNQLERIVVRLERQRRQIRLLWAFIILIVISAGVAVFMATKKFTVIIKKKNGDEMNLSQLITEKANAIKAKVGTSRAPPPDPPLASNLSYGIHEYEGNTVSGMNANLLNVVKRIVAEEGEGVLADTKKLKPLFSDYSKGESKEERLAFGHCVEIGAYRELRNAGGIDERRRKKAGLADYLHSKTGMDKVLYVAALDILEAAVFAPRQSASSASPNTQSKKFCGKCGTPLTGGTQFCNNCGNPL